MRMIIVAFALALAACARPAPEAQAPEAASAQPASPFVGDYIAASTTAMSITGDLSVAPDVLSFARGFRIEGPRVAATLSGDTDLSAGGGTANSGSGLAIAALELRRIENVRVAADARAPDLCGGVTPTYLILGRSGDTLSLQIFSGAEAPGPQAHDTALCGIYNFAARA